MADNLDNYYKQSQDFSHSHAKSYLDHLSQLDIDDEPYSVRHTGIICTIGNTIPDAIRRVPFFLLL